MTVLNYTARLTVHNCPDCQILHAIPEERETKMLEDRDNGREQKWVYCPNGHRWSFSGKSKVQIEREKRERLERQLANRDEDLRAERASHAATKGQLTAAKGQITKAKNRVARGVCPCCNRSFPQLAEHMKTEHPDYQESPTP